MKEKSEANINSPEYEKKDLTQVELEELLNKVEEAKNNAPNEEEFFRAENEREDAVAEFVRGEKSLQWLNEQIDSIVPGEVEIPSIDVLERVILGFTKNHEFAKEQANHEKEHLDAAVKAGLKPILKIRFLRKKDGKISFFPSVSMDIPKVGDENEIRMGIIKSTEEVTELSPSDQEAISKYKDKN